jgi:hypothetical protein
MLVKRDRCMMFFSFRSHKSGDRPRSVAFNLLLAIVATAASSVFFCQRVQAQFVETLAPRIKDAASGMRSYYEQHKKFPGGGPEMEGLVKYIYGQVNVNPAPPMAQVEYTSRGYVRYVNVCVSFDPSIANVSIEAWRKNPPSSWQGEPNDIVVSHDGERTFLVWAVGLDARPIRESGGEKQALIVYEKLSKQDEEQTYEE